MPLRHRTIGLTALFVALSAIFAAQAVLPVSAFLTSASIIPSDVGLKLTAQGSSQGGGACATPPGVAGKPFYVPNSDLCLIEPIAGGNTMPAASGINMAINYFNRVWPWLVGSTAGIALVQAVVGGVMIMSAGADTGKREAGQSCLTWAILGLLLIGFAGFILRVLNPTFYK